MTAREIAKAVCPPIIADAARWLLRDRRPVVPGVSQEWRIWYEPVSAWSASSDGHPADLTRPADWEQDLAVLDNLEAVRLIPMTEATVLDYGCGNGKYGTILKAVAHTAKWEYTGADINPALIDFCRATYPATRFELAEDSKPLPFPDDAVDVVLASGVVQFVHDMPTILAELRRVTRDYVLVSRLPTWKYQDSRIVRQHVRGIQGEAQYPLHVSNRQKIEALFARAGLSVIFRDSGSEVYWIPGEREPVGHTMYLLRKTRKTTPTWR